MASRTALLITAAMAIVVVGALLLATALAEDYMVWDDRGWSLGVDYDAWVSGKTFKVNDTLVFVYSVGHHNVLIVDSANYAACRAPIGAPTLYQGIDNWTFDKAGQFFFICGFEGHCQSGMSSPSTSSDVIRWIAMRPAVTSSAQLALLALSCLYAQPEA